MLYLAHTREETAQMFGISVNEVEGVLQRCLAVLKEWREKNRPRPHLDDKVVAAWNGLMVCGVSILSSVMLTTSRFLDWHSHPRSCLARKALKL